MSGTSRIGLREGLRRCDAARRAMCFHGATLTALLRTLDAATRWRKAEAAWDAFHDQKVEAMRRDEEKAVDSELEASREALLKELDAFDALEIRQP